MSNVTSFKAEVSPFNTEHPHKWFQHCELLLNHCGTETRHNLFLSCPETGLDDELIQQYLSHQYYIEEFNSDSLSDGCYWLPNGEDSVAITPCNEAGTIVGGAPVFSIEDPAINALRSLYPKLFTYTIDL